MADIPVVAIVGSANQRLMDARTYDPPVAHLDDAKQAAQEIGRAIAEKGWHLQIYSLHPDFIETDVFNGYASPEVGDPELKAVYVYHPQGEDQDGVIAQAKKALPFKIESRPSPHERWEVSFFRSFRSAVAIVIFGGAKSTLSFGLIALSQRLPIYSVAHFGGSSKSVWQAIEVGQDLPTKEHRNWMGSAWSGVDSARRCTQALEEQMKLREEQKKAEIEGAERRKKQEEERARREAEQEEQEQLAAKEEAASRARAQALRNTLLLFSGCLALSLVATVFFVVDWGTANPPARGPMVSLLLAALFAGATGSSVLGLLTAQSAAADSPSLPWQIGTILLGAVAGFAGGLIFVLGQFVTLPEDQAITDELRAKQLRNMIPFVAIIALVAGLTWDSFFNRLRKNKVSTEIPSGGG